MKDNKINNLEKSKNLKAKKEIKLVRTVFFGEDIKRLDAIESRMNDQIAQMNTITDNLPEAITMLSSDRGDGLERLSDASVLMIEQGLGKSIKKDKKVISEAIYPVMGNAIVKFLVQFGKEIQDSINRRVHALSSWQGIKWLFESLRLGIPFAEYLEKKTEYFKIFRFHIFNKDTCDFLYTYTEDDFIKQLNIDSSLPNDETMWIQKKILEDNETKNIHLPNNEDMLDDLKVFVNKGTNYNLVAVYSGACLTEMINKIQDMSTSLDALGPKKVSHKSYKDILKNGLIEHKPSVDVNSKNSLKAIYLSISLLILGYLGWASYKSYKWESLIGDIRSAKDLVLFKAERNNGVNTLLGLKNIGTNSLDRILEKYNIKKLKSDFAEVDFSKIKKFEKLNDFSINSIHRYLVYNLSLDNEEKIKQQLSLLKNVNDKKISEAIDNAKKDFKHLIESSKTKSFLEWQKIDLLNLRKKLNIPDSLVTNIDDNKVVISGVGTEIEINKLKEGIKTVIGITKVELSKLDNLTKSRIRLLKKEIENTSIYFVLGKQNKVNEESFIKKLNTISKKFNSLVTLSKRFKQFPKLEVTSSKIIGKNTEVNSEIEKSRTTYVINELNNSGINKNNLINNDKSYVGKGSQEGKNGKVIFRVKNLNDL